MTDSSVKMLSVLTGHADYIGDVIVHIISDVAGNTIPNQKIYEYERMRVGISKSFAGTDSEPVTCGVW